jgi:Zn-dependent peptidase ImmA (M78 family)
LLRRGFKSQSERRSAEIRRRLNLAPASPLNAFDVAEHVGGITVWSAEQIEGLSGADLHQLTVKDAESWSAFTLKRSNRHLVVYNPAQSKPRINSVVMHEVSHILLGHELVSAGLSGDGHLVPGNFNQDQEDEADWLGGTLLLPRPALLAIRRDGLSDGEARDLYLVSHQMLTWRFRMTGVDYQLANAKRKRRRAG